MERLRQLRASGERRSGEVLALADAHWKDIQRLGNERWMVYEQVFLAALDRPDHAARREECFKLLQARFPGSNRVRRLRAAQHEADGEFDQARDIYEAMLKVNPADAVAMKRKIAILLATNQQKSAIKELNEYLTLFASDAEAWQQLVDIYIEDANLEGAAFALEELILINPHHHVYHTLYAEIQYTKRDFIMARKCFAKAIEYNPKSLRALYGLLLCIRTDREKQKAPHRTTQVDPDDDAWTLEDLEKGAQQQILKALEQAPKHLRDLADKTLGLRVSRSTSSD